MIRVLFVCLGNICRSPLAEAAFRHEAGQAGLEVEADSAGTGGWHVGNPPDPRAQHIAAVNGVDISDLRARQFSHGDFADFTHIFAMDHDNLDAISAMMPHDATAQVALLLDLVPGREGEAVADPYFGGDDGFAVTWADVHAAAKVLVRHLA